MNLPLFEQIFPDKPLAGHKPLSGADLRDAGIQQAWVHLERVKAEYIETCLQKIAELKTGALMTSEDLREMVGDPPTGCENAIAGIFKKAISRKLIVKTGEERPAKRTSVHAKNLCIWRRCEKS